MTSATTSTAPKYVETTMKGMAGSTVVKAIEDAYKALRRKNPDLPEVLFVTGSGLMGLGAKWGHYWADAWTMQDGKLVNAETGALPEIFIAGERLECPEPLSPPRGGGLLSFHEQERPSGRVSPP